MSIETAIERVADKIAESYQVVREKGGALPVQKNIHNLPDAIRTIDGDFAFGSYEWWCPKMTGPHSPEPYAVGAHIWNTLDTPWKAFDGSDKTYWGNVYSNKIKAAHLKFDFGEETKIAGIQLVEYSKRPGALPKVVRITGSNDDVIWDDIVIDDRSDWTWCESPRNIQFDVVKYRYYQIDCIGGTWLTDDSTDSYTIAIAEVNIATFQRDLSYCPVITLQEKTVAPSVEPQDILPDNGYIGLSKVTVEAADLQKKTIQSSLESQIVVADDDYYGLGEVTIDPFRLQAKEIVTNLGGQTVTPDEGYDGLSEVTIAEAELQKKTVTPTTTSQKIVADREYDALSEVTVEAVALQTKSVDTLMTPQTVSPDEGYLGLSEVVIAPPKTQEKTVTPSESLQEVVADETNDALSKVTVEKIPDIYKDTSDATASADDILEGKTAYINGEKVTGTAPGTSSEPKLQEKTVTPGGSVTEVLPDSSYDGLLKVTVEAATLQEKTVIPTTSSQTIRADDEHYGMSQVTVEKIPDIYKDTSDATAGPSDITTGKTAYVNGEKLVGTMSISPDADYDWWSPRMTSNTTSEAMLAHANLQTKTATPKASTQIIEPDKDYDGLSSVTVNGDNNLAASNIRSGVSIFGVEGSYDPTVILEDITITPTTSVQTKYPSTGVDGFSDVTVKAIPSKYKDTSDATAVASNILSGKTAYGSSGKITGTMGTVVVPTPTIEVGSTGLITASNTQTAGYTAGGTKSATSQLTRKTAETFTPTTTNQIISSGQYLTGTQTIKGDSNLKAVNIKSGVSIFGVSGSYTGETPSLQSKTVTPTTSSQSVTPDSSYDGLSKVTVKAIPSEYKDTSDGTAAASDIKSGKTAYVNGSKVTGTLASRTPPNPTISVSSAGLITANYSISAGYVAATNPSATKQLTTQSAKTWTPTINAQTISSGTYLTGTQTIKGDSNLVAANIKSGVSIFGVSGSYKGDYPEGYIDPSKQTMSITVQSLPSSTEHTIFYQAPFLVGGTQSLLISSSISSKTITVMPDYMAMISQNVITSTSASIIRSITLVSSQCDNSWDEPIIWVYSTGSALPEFITNVGQSVTVSSSNYIYAIKFGTVADYNSARGNYTGTGRATIKFGV